MARADGHGTSAAGMGSALVLGSASVLQDGLFAKYRVARRQRRMSFSKGVLL
jgi:hypothetical protein